MTACRCNCSVFGDEPHEAEARHPNPVACVHSGPDTTSMTPRQYEAVRNRALGFTAAETARRMGISEGTVKQHLTAVYQMTGAFCLEDALRALGWLQVPHTSAGLRASSAGSAPARRELRAA